LKHGLVIAGFFAARYAIAKPFASFWIHVAWLIALAAFPRSNGATLPAFDSPPFGLNEKPARQLGFFFSDFGANLPRR